MSWLRIDDQMPLNGKVGELTDTEYRALTALWAYCARKRNDGVFARSEIRHAIYATPRGPRCVRDPQLERYINLGLVHPEGDVYAVNDWRKYQPNDPTAAERMRRFRERTEP